MAKRASVHVETRDDRAALVAASMPDDRAGLLAVGAEAIDALHAAIMECDDAAADAAADRYDAAVWKLTGGTFFASMDRTHPDAGGILIEDHCRAAPGTVPKWGQNGEFLITVAGISAVVEISDGFGRFVASMSFHVVDRGMPFISETGYRSHFEDYRGGVTVDQAAVAVFGAYLAKGRKPLAPQYRHERDQDARAWLDTMPQVSAAEMAFVEVGGQMAFGF